MRDPARLSLSPAANGGHTSVVGRRRRSHAAVSLGERETFAAIRAIIPMAVERVAVIDDLEQKGDGERLLLLCGVIRLAEQLDDRESCVILPPATDSGPQSDPSVAIWSAQRNSDILAEAIGKPIEVVGPDP